MPAGGAGVGDFAGGVRRIGKLPKRACALAVCKRLVFPIGKILFDVGFQGCLYFAFADIVFGRQIVNNRRDWLAAPIGGFTILVDSFYVILNPGFGIFGLGLRRLCSRVSDLFLLGIDRSRYRLFVHRRLMGFCLLLYRPCPASSRLPSARHNTDMLGTKPIGGERPLMYQPRGR